MGLQVESGEEVSSWLEQEQRALHPTAPFHCLPLGPL